MGLIIPLSHVIHEKPPKYACTLCEAVFTEDERSQYERHVLRAHSLEEVQEQSPRHWAPGIFDPRAGDAEWSDWIARNAAAGNDPMRYMRTDDGKHSSGIGDG